MKSCAGVILTAPDPFSGSAYSSAIIGIVFSTLDWPNKTYELERFYPGNVLVTGFDIIFFWVARMMMMGSYFMKQTPFKLSLIHI